MSARVAWLLAGLTFAFVVGDTIVTARYRPMLSEAAIAEHGFPFNTLAVIGSAVLGAIILSTYERHAVGALLNLIGVVGSFSLVTEAYTIWVLHEEGPGPTSLAGISGWLSSVLGGQVAIGGLAVMFLLAPDGRFLSRRWAWVAGVIAFGVLLCSGAVASQDPTSFDLQDTDVGGVRGPLFTVGFALMGAGLVASVVSMGIRLRRSRGEARQQVRLLALAVTLLVVGLANVIVVQAVNGGRQTWVASLPLLVAYLLLPILFGVAALRYRLYAIEVVVNRTVVLAVGIAFAGLGYTTLVVLIGRLVDTQTSGLWLSVLATTVVAVAFQPLRRAVVRLANRIAHGPRAQPYEALSDFSRRLAETPTPATLLPAVAEAAGRAVAARRAVAALQAPDEGAGVSAVWGGDQSEDGTVAHVVAVRSGGVTLGTIQVEVLKKRPLRPSDERLLSALADQAAVAFRNTAIESQLADHVQELDRTTRALTESRTRIIDADVMARKELEAAISRDVLPRLVALPGQLRTARAAVERREPANGLDLLVASTNAALESLRELTRGVFPTQLARGGLEPALRGLLGRMDPAPTLLVDHAAAARRFPSRVETAVYFCCVEALRLAPTTVEVSVTGPELVLRVGGLTRPAGDLPAVVDRVEAVDGSLSVTDHGLALHLPIEPKGAG
jgi:hypothetical protein